MKRLLAVVSPFLLALGMVFGMTSCTSGQEEKNSFTVGKNTFLLNGQPFVVKAAEIHYPRIPEPYWEHRILSCKALGMNTICLYVFWNLHEQQPGDVLFIHVTLVPWPVCLRRVGNGRIALVAAEKAGYTAPHARPLLHGAGGNLYG